MLINRIVLDLDDTINSLTMHILNRLGCDVGPFEYDKFPTNFGYDIIGAWSYLTGREKVDVGTFWEWIGRKMWAEAPRSHQFWLVDHAATLVGRENVLIATSPTKSADCLFGKYQWIEANLPQWIHRQYSVTPRKSWLAQPGVLLLDDCEKNIDDFTMAGGDGILVPRPWNVRGDKNTNYHLSKELGRRQYVFSSPK